MSGPRWQRLMVQVIVFIFLPLTILVLVVAFGSTSLHQNAMRSLVGERDERAARSVANAINTHLLHRVDLIQNLALQGRDQALLDDILASSAYLDQEFDIGLAYLSADGALLATRGSADIWEGLLETMPFPMEQGGNGLDTDVHFTKAIPYPHPNNFVVIAYASAGHSDPIAVGAFSIASVAHQSLVSAFNPGEHASAILADEDQQILYSIGNVVPGHVNVSHPGVQEALAGESGATYLSVMDSEHVIAYSSIPLVDWAVVIEEPWESVTNPVLNTTQLAPLILVPILILFMVALWLGARRIIQPLQSLEDKAVKLAWGDFHAIEEPVDGIEEINRLQHTLIHMAHSLKVAQQGLRGYIGAITAGQEEERRRLARELHDETIQALIALNQRVQLVRLAFEDDPIIDDSLQEIQTLTGGTIADLRRLTRALRPLYLEDLGLVAALEMLAREISQSAEILIDVQQLGSERRLSAEVELALYRIAQEALSNVVKHSQAERATLTLHYKQETVALIVVDDGCGFEVPESPAEFAPGGHFGLLGMYERAELVGADLEIHSSPEVGTRLVVTVPVS